MDITKQIVHKNELVDEAGYSVTIDEMRLLNFALSKIDPKKSNPGVIEIYSSDFASMYGLPTKHLYRNMRNSTKELMRKPVALPYVNEKTGEKRVLELAWLSSRDYAVGELGSSIKIKFSEEITPYLFNISKKFTSCNFEYASKLNTPFSFRLYQWLKKAEGLDKHQQGESYVVELNVEDMKTRAALGSYPEWQDFKRRVIQPAITQINTKTDLSVVWKPVKNGRTVHAIEFIYVVESGVKSFDVPLRPRLKRRPKVLAGSHEEGVWMRANLKLLSDFEKAQKEYDPTDSMTLSDLRKMALYAEKTGNSLAAERYNKQLEERQSKSAV